MSNKESIIITKMIKYCNDSIKYITENTFESFTNNELHLTYSVFALSQLGELSTKLDKEFKEKKNAIPWNALKSIRNRIVHDYDGVQHRVLWDTLTNDIPKLITQLEGIKEQG